MNIDKIITGVNLVSDVIRSAQAAEMAQRIAHQVVNEAGFKSCVIEIDGQRAVATRGYGTTVEPVAPVAPVDPFSVKDPSSAYKFMDLYRMMKKLSYSSSGFKLNDWVVTGERYNCCMRIRYGRTDVMTIRFRDKDGDSVSVLGNISDSYIRVENVKIGGRDSYYIEPKRAPVIGINTNFAQVNWAGLDTHGEEIRDVLIAMIESKRFL